VTTHPAASSRPRVAATPKPTDESSSAPAPVVHASPIAASAPAAHEVVPATPRLASTSTPRRRTPAVPRARISEPRSLDSPSAAPTAAGFAPSERVATRGNRYGVLLALLLATLAAAALWSYLPAAYERRSGRGRR
jgi:hypothetical protein